MGEWTIRYYIAPSGDIPVMEFIQSLPERTVSKVLRAIDLLSLFGIFAKAPHVKKLVGTPLWELRVIGGDNIRIFYFIHTEKTCILLHGCVKKTNKTSQRELAAALKRYELYLRQK